MKWYDYVFKILWNWIDYFTIFILQNMNQALPSHPFRSANVINLDCYSWLHFLLMMFKHRIHHKAGISASVTLHLNFFSPAPSNAFWNQIRSNLINLTHYFCFIISCTWRKKIKLELSQEPTLLHDWKYKNIKIVLLKYFRSLKN